MRKRFPLYWPSCRVATCTFILPGKAPRTDSVHDRDQGRRPASCLSPRPADPELERMIASVIAAVLKKWSRENRGEGSPNQSDEVASIGGKGDRYGG